MTGGSARARGVERPGRGGDGGNSEGGIGMRGRFREVQHLVRAALLFLAGVAAFLLLRQSLVPKGFGEYGHFRSGALEDNRGRPLQFAGMAACEECHSDVVEARKGSKHAAVRCEACHGPLAAHASDPTTGKPVRPDPKTVCLVCHRDNVAKPRGFPKVDPGEHGGGEACNTCHKPHHPEVA